MESRVAITGRGTKVVDNDTTITTVAIIFNTSNQALAIKRLNSMASEFKSKLSKYDIDVNVREIYSASADRVTGIFKRISTDTVMCTDIIFRYKSDNDIDAIIRSICDKVWDVVVETSISITTEYTLSKELYSKVQKEVYAEAMDDAYETLSKLIKNMITNTQKLASKSCIVSKIIPLYVQVGGAPILSSQNRRSLSGDIAFSSCNYNDDLIENYNIEKLDSSTRIDAELNIEFEVVLEGS